MTVVLLDDANGELCLRQELVASLGRLGGTNVALVRDEQLVGIVLEGWLFDPVRSAGAVVEAAGATPGARALHPVLHLAVSTAAHEGGEVLTRCRRALTSAGLAAAVVTATSVLGISAAAAGGGPPQDGGGCHMVASPSSTGLTQMMVGSAGSANGIGVENMAGMLSLFSPEPFCGL